MPNTFYTSRLHSAPLLKIAAKTTEKYREALVRLACENVPASAV